MADQNNTGGPLSGLKVVEFDGLGPTPFSAMQLADMGANVIRIARKTGTQAANQFTDVVIRNRSYIELDLKDVNDIAIAKKIVSHSDILIEGFRPGVMERLGLGPSEMLSENKKLVYGRMTGWGQKGPLSNTAGHDINYISISGALHAIGTKDTPIAPLNLLGDFAAGSMYLVFGILCAVLHAKQTGQGQVLDGSIVDGTANLMAMMYSMFNFNQWEDRREINLLDGCAPFYTTYKTIIRNTILACFLVVPLSVLFGRNSVYVFIFLIGFVFNEMLHVALAYHQSKGDFVISSKQIIVRTILYGIGGWLIIYFQYSIFWIIVFQTIILIIFYFVAHSSLPTASSNTENNYSTQDLTSSGRKMVLTTFAAALLSELDIVILGVFYSGPILGVLAWSKRILEGLYQLVGASLDIVFPEISKLKNKDEITSVRSKLRIVILISLFIPIAYILLEDIANSVFINILGAEFENLASIFSVVIFSLPFMLWSRINIIFARAMHYEVNLFKVISAAAFASFPF